MKENIKAATAMNADTCSAEELHELRNEMKNLRSLLAEQQIVSDNIIRRAMQTDINKERKDITFSIGMGVAGCLTSLLLYAIVKLPLWFCIVTALFLATAITASAYSLRKYMSMDMTSENMLNVASNIMAYKKFGNDWLKFSIPFLIIWLTCFFYLTMQNIDNDAILGCVYGGIVGAVTGTVLGIMHLYNSHKRMNGILKQIEEMRKG